MEADKWKELVLMFRERLHLAFEDWLKTNADVIGDRWYDNLMKQIREVDDSTAIAVMGTAMWIFNMTAQFGVMAGIGPSTVNLQGLAPELDEKSTKRLLLIISATMNLQYLPKEIALKSYPIITAKKFSLQAFVELPESERQ